MNGKNIIILLFLIFGIYAIINPDGISIENTQKSYNVSDLIRGWGIYSITIGSILLFPDNIKFTECEKSISKIKNLLRNRINNITLKKNLYKSLECSF